jgi:protocatechuate 3,4-dioxygenase beta subunit
MACKSIVLQFTYLMVVLQHNGVPVENAELPIWHGARPMFTALGNMWRCDAEGREDKQPLVLWACAA